MGGISKEILDAALRDYSRQNDWWNELVVSGNAGGWPAPERLVVGANEQPTSVRTEQWDGNAWQTVKTLPTVTTSGTTGDLPATPTVVVDFPNPPAQQLNVNVWNGTEYVPLTPMTPQPDWSQFTWDFQPVAPAAPRRRTRRNRRRVAAKPVPLDAGRRAIDLDM